jgi:hypothetical protein
MLKNSIEEKEISAKQLGYSLDYREQKLKNNINNILNKLVI